MNREYLIAICIDCGVISLIEPDGQIGHYRQRGINGLTDTEIREEVKCHRLNPNWMHLKELPSHYSIQFEDEEIMGKAYATYELVRKKRSMQRKLKANRAVRNR